MNARLPARSLLKLAALAAILLLAAPSCQKEEPESQLPDYSNDITNTANALSASWLKDQLDTYPEENICLSSFPLVMLVSALAAGADGDTARQLWQFTAQSLSENGSSPADFNPSSYLHHIRQLNGLFAKNIPGYYLYNGLYANKKVELFSRYKKGAERRLKIIQRGISAAYILPVALSSPITHPSYKIQIYFAIPFLQQDRTASSGIPMTQRKQSPPGTSRRIKRSPKSVMDLLPQLDCNRYI